MTDIPMMIQNSPIKELEIAAITTYRTKYPDGPLWQDLHAETRVMWMRMVERRESK